MWRHCGRRGLPPRHIVMLRDSGASITPPLLILASRDWSLASRAMKLRSPSRGAMRPRFAGTLSLQMREQGMPGARCTRGLVCNVRKKSHTSIQVQSEHSGIPCAMALRLMPRSPRRRIRLASVVGELTADSNPVGLRLRLRQFGTSNGCRDHTVLPYAAADCRSDLAGLAPFVSRFIGRPALRTCFAPDAAASTASHPNVRDDRDTPLVERMRRGNYGADLGEAGSGIFLREGLDG